jgi:hypothetical protein
VVQTADFGSHHDAAGRLDGASHRSILAEREVRARSLVVRDVGPKDSTKGRSLKTMTWEFFARQVLANHSLGLVVSATTVRTWLRAAGLGPAGRRGAMTWREFVRAHRRSMLAVDFFTVETVWLQRLYVLFFTELAAAVCISRVARQLLARHG